MTSTYTTAGSLTNPVNDLAAARAYLVQEDMSQYAPDGLPIHSICWDLTNDSSWKVTVVTERELTADESATLSDWILGQNSDGLGEGFEQQPFAEEDDEDDEYCVIMSSFDWQANECLLTLVK